MGLLEFMTKCLHSGERKKERKKEGKKERKMGLARIHD